MKRPSACASPPPVGGESLRILAVTPYYEPEGGGLECYAHALLRRLAARGHDVRAIAFTRRGLTSGSMDGVQVIRREPRWVLSNTPLDPGFTRFVRDAIRDARPSVLWAHAPVPFPAEMAWRAAEREGVPFVLTFHAGQLRGGSPLLDVLARLDRATAQRAMMRGAERLVAVSPYVHRHALRAWSDKATIIAPGVDAERFQPGASASKPSILFVGPLDEAYRWKGIDVLWKAFARVRAQVPSAELVLVGDGPRRAALEASAARDFGPGAVRFLGRLNPEALVRAYQQATVATLPSTSDAESFGMVLAEANACGKPVVGSRIGGIPDFVRHGENGLLCEPGDPESLAQALVAILQDPASAQRMGVRGRKIVLAHHDWDVATEAIEAVLAAAAASRGKPGTLPDGGRQGLVRGLVRQPRELREPRELTQA